jgi:hypothetical protein
MATKGAFDETCVVFTVSHTEMEKQVEAQNTINNWAAPNAF